MFEITVAGHISAAHFLRGYPGECANIHGHTWRIEVALRGENLNGLGLLMDFNDVKVITKDILDSYDHKLINDVPPFNEINPTSENLARHLFYMIRDRIPSDAGVNVSRVTVSESRDTSATYYET